MTTTATAPTRMLPDEDNPDSCPACGENISTCSWCGVTVESALSRLNADLRQAARLMGQRETRHLVDTYYTMQQYRIRAASQLRALTQEGNEQAGTVLDWEAKHFRNLENTLKRALAAYAAEHLPSRWAMSIVGVGPVIAAGLMAHIDITKAHTVGHIWRFAGLDPTVSWSAGQVRPWNEKLKTILVYKAGESFVKVQNREGDYYGHVFAARKRLEWERNVNGQFADDAARALAAKSYGRDTDAFKWYSGQITADAAREHIQRADLTGAVKVAGEGRGVPMLPPAHIHARARRYATKLFASHLHHVMYEAHYGEPPPKPYIFTKQARAAGLGEHSDYAAPPNWPMT